MEIALLLKFTLRVLSVVPLEEIEELNDAAAVLCNNCERTVHNISHYQSKVDSLKTTVTEMLSSLTPAGKRLACSVQVHEGPPQAKQSCLHSDTLPTEDVASPVSPEVKVNFQ